MCRSVGAVTRVTTTRCLACISRVNCCGCSVAGGPRTASLHYLLLQTWLAEEPGRARGQRLVEVREGDRLPPAQVMASCVEGEEM